MRLHHTEERRALMTPQESHETNLFILDLREYLDAPVTFSNVVRAMLHLLRTHGKRVNTQARRTVLHRPENGDFEATQEFEQHLAQLFHKALKRAAVK